MTDRFKGCVVTFETDIREDDAECLLTAIRCIRGVASVTPSVASGQDHMNRERIRREYVKELYEFARQVAEKS
jgi:hypothetical protein